MNSHFDCMFSLRVKNGRYLIAINIVIRQVNMYSVSNKHHLTIEVYLILINLFFPDARAATKGCRSGRHPLIASRYRR